MKRTLLFFGLLGLLCLTPTSSFAQTKATIENVSPELQIRIRTLMATLGPDPSRGSCMPNSSLPTNQAKEELIAIGKPATLPLCVVLTEKDVWRRIMAVEALVEIRDPRALQPLLYTLQYDSSEYVRSQAAEALGNLGDTEAVPHLINALKIRSKDPKAPDLTYAAGKAAEALSKIGDKRAIPALMTLLGSRLYSSGANGGFGTRLGKEAAEALGKLGSQAAEPLMQLLHHSNRAVRSDAAKTLGVMKEKQAVPMLLRLLTSYVNAPYSENSYEDSKVSTEIIEALGEIGDKQATLPLLRMADVKTLRHADYYSIDTNRCEMIRALGKIGDRRVVPALLSLRTTKSRPLREIALTALTQIRTPEVAEPLLDALEEEREGSEYSSVYDEIIEALGLMRETRALPSLQKALHIDGIADEAAVAIGRIDGSLLLSLLQNGDVLVRRAVVHGLGETGGEQTIPHLLPLRHDEEIGGWAVEALGKLGTPELLPILEPLMREKNNGNRWAARRAVIAIKQRHKL